MSTEPQQQNSAPNKSGKIMSFLHAHNIHSGEDMFAVIGLLALFVVAALVVLKVVSGDVLIKWPF